jgi:hypothetical protein
VKRLVVALVAAAAVSVAALPVSGMWTHSFDARPEALATGGALLMLASVLRRSNITPRR